MSQTPAPIVVRDETGRELHRLDLHNNTITMTEADGRLVTMDLGQQDVHIDSALANYAAGYRQVSGIADAVLPVAQTDKASDKYFTWDKDDILQDVQDLVVGPGGAVKEISPRLSSDTYSTVGYGVGSFVPTELEANADAPLQPFQAAINRCMNAVKIGRERRAAALLMASGSWTGGYTTTLGATAKWNAGSASDPVKDLYTAIEAALTPVNGVVLSERTAHDFIMNPAVQKYPAYKSMIAPLPNTSSGVGSAQLTEFAATLGLPPFYIGFMKGKTGAATHGYVWGDNVALIFVDPGMPADGQTISTAKTFRWTGANSAVPDGTMVGGFLVRTYFDPKRGARGGKMVVLVHNDAEKMTSVYAGGLIIAAHQ